MNIFINFIYHRTWRICRTRATPSQLYTNWRKHRRNGKNYRRAKWNEQNIIFPPDKMQYDPASAPDFSIFKVNFKNEIVALFHLWFFYISWIVFFEQCNNNKLIELSIGLLIRLLSSTSLLLLLVFVGRSVVEFWGVSEVREDLPGVLEVEFTVFLGKFKRLLDNSHKIVIVSNFIITS